MDNFTVIMVVAVVVLVGLIAGEVILRLKIQRVKKAAADAAWQAEVQARVTAGLNAHCLEQYQERAYEHECNPGM